MRMLLPAAAAAVVVMVAVVVVGFRVAEDDEPTWGERASEICLRGRSDTLAIIAASDRIADPVTSSLHAYGGSTDVEAGVIEALERLPRPSDDATTIGGTLRAVKESHLEDRAMLRRLRREFDVVLLQTRIEEATNVLAHVRGRFAALGAPGCVRYYDPQAYE